MAIPMPLNKRRSACKDTSLQTIHCRSIFSPVFGWSKLPCGRFILVSGSYWDTTVNWTTDGIGTHAGRAQLISSTSPEAGKLHLRFLVFSSKSHIQLTFQNLYIEPESQEKCGIEMKWTGRGRWGCTILLCTGQ